MKILLIDPFYNNGVVPPNYSLGEIEKYIVDTNVEIEVIDFVHKNKIENLDEFKKLENDFINKIVEKVKKETESLINVSDLKILEEYEDKCIKNRVSPGGSADILAVTIFLCKVYY